MKYKDSWYNTNVPVSGIAVAYNAGTIDKAQSLGDLQLLQDRKLGLRRTGRLFVDRSGAGMAMMKLWMFVRRKPYLSSPQSCTTTDHSDGSEKQTIKHREDEEGCSRRPAVEQSAAKLRQK